MALPRSRRALLAFLVAATVHAAVAVAPCPGAEPLATAPSAEHAVASDPCPHHAHEGAIAAPLVKPRCPCGCGDSAPPVAFDPAGKPTPASVQLGALARRPEPLLAAPAAQPPASPVGGIDHVPLPG
ncbi:MAG TPA: hypothetical protein VHQ66_09635 [Myxococcota bacterium]|nr:hypothetical protein [Myxococcota bacterium]